MGDYGAKVSRPGYDVKTAAPDELVFSSKYTTLRVKAQGSGTITHSGGRSATIAHNLGYIPYFLVHTTPDPLFASGSGFYSHEDDYYIHPFVPVVAGACHIDRGVIAKADSTNLYIEIGDDFGWEYFYPANADEDYARQYPGNYNYGWTRLGFVSYGVYDAGFRFRNILVSQGTNLYKAEMGHYISWRSGSSNVKTKIYGIDVDNVDKFNSTGAFSNPKTTAYTTNECSSSFGAGDTWSFDVKNQVQEILNRGGWSSGNALGITLWDNGTDTGSDNYIDDNASGGAYCKYSFLRIMRSNTLLNYKYTIFYNKIE